MLSQIKAEISLYCVNVLTSNLLTAFMAINYFIHGVRFKRFYFLFENFPCYFLSVLFLLFLFVCLFVCGAANPNTVYGLLIHDVSTSHTTSHHSR